MKNICLALLALITYSCSNTPQNLLNEKMNWALMPFVKVDQYNPVLLPDTLSRFYCPIRRDSVKWEAKDVFNPATVVKDGKIHMIYRAEDWVGKYNGTSRLGLAISENGIQFNKTGRPIFYPDNDTVKYLEWEGGVEDPRIIEREDGVYFMTYTAYDGETARLLIASSSDLLKWEKYGSAFPEAYIDLWSKSGSIIAELKGERLVAKKIKGKYWMYFGDKHIHLASSEDLIHWQPLIDENERLKTILSYRSGYFDSDLVEPGPPAIITPNGILLIYNGRNFGQNRDPLIPEGTYSAGQALFDLEHPDKLLERLEKPFFSPDKDYEIEGQVNRVVFLEGLVPFKGNWYLYYGTADSKIAVAKCPL